uniref:Somatolactin alpha n=1 Tax=Astyanax mexicanus TaxID=7994 RepID=W5KL20_ASTMX
MWCVCVCVLVVQAWFGSAPLPLDCSSDSASLSRCSSISQEKLMDRVIQHAELISRISDECCTLFEEMFVPYSARAFRIPGGNSCITKAFPIPIPSSKTELQQISITLYCPLQDKWLLHSVLMLVQSWIEPMVYLQSTLDRYDDAPETLLNRTKWVSDKLISLEQGVVFLIRKEGKLSPVSVHEPGVVQDDVHPEVLESVLRDYTVMETFLKLLKCRQTDRLSCGLY